MMTLNDRIRVDEIFLLLNCKTHTQDIYTAEMVLYVAYIHTKKSYIQNVNVNCKEMELV